MSKTSLIEVSAIVVVATLAAFIVDAKQPVELGEITNDTVKELKNDYTHLVAKFDADKNGLLSKAEVAASKNDVLMRNFNTIDTNGDENISNEELTDYSANIQVK